eukprot:UN12063
MKMKCILKASEEIKEQIYLKCIQMDGNKARVFGLDNKFARKVLKPELFFNVSIEILEMCDNEMQSIPIEIFEEFGVL